MSHRKAFTLVELLVVIGIIAILIAILLPALNKARDAGSRVTCLSNMRQIGMSMQMYVNENKGFLPRGRWDTAPDKSVHGTRWLVRQSSIYKFSGGKYSGGNWVHNGNTPTICPADYVSVNRGNLRDSTWEGASYFANGRVIAYDDSAGSASNKKITSINKPSERIMVTEKWGYWYGSIDRGVTSSSWNTAMFRSHSVQIGGVWTTGNLFGTQHKNLINVLMVDGSGDTWPWARMDASINGHNASTPPAGAVDWWYWRD